MSHQAAPDDPAHSGKADLVVGVLLILLGSATLYTSRSFPTTAVATDIGAGAFPSAYAVLLIVLALLLISNHLARPRGAGPMPGERPNLLMPAAGALLTLAYVIAIPWAGYAIATPFFMFALMRLLGLRKPLPVALIALGTTAVLYLVFDIGMSVALPAGVFFE